MPPTRLTTLPAGHIFVPTDGEVLSSYLQAYTYYYRGCYGLLGRICPEEESCNGWLPVKADAPL